MAAKIPAEAHEVIRKIYKSTGITQLQIANALGVTRLRILQIINGHKAVKRANGTWSVTKPDDE